METKSWFDKEVEQLKEDFEFRLESHILDFTRQVAEIMTAKNIKRSELATRMGVSKPYVTELLSGKPNLTFESMLKLADALGSSMNVFITDESALRNRSENWVKLKSLLSSQAPARLVSTGDRESQDAWANGNVDTIDPPQEGSENESAIAA